LLTMRALELIVGTMSPWPHNEAHCWNNEPYNNNELKCPHC
jgi:hypothetical protein